MTDRRLLAIATLLGVLLPSRAWAEPFSMRFNFALAELPPYLEWAVVIWIALCVAALARNLWQALRLDKDDRPSNMDLLGRVASYLFGAVLPLAIVSQLLDREFFVAKLASLPLAAVWILLAGPALLVAATTTQRKVIRWVSLGVADIVALVWLLHALLKEERAPQFLWLAAFALLIHAVALLPKQKHSLFRLAGLAGLLFFSANFIQPPGAMHDLLVHKLPPVQQLAGVTDPVRTAVIGKGGKHAFLVTETAPRTVQKVSLQTGLVVDRRELKDATEVLLLATDPPREQLVALTTGGDTPLYLLDPDLLFTTVALHGPIGFSPVAMDIAKNHLAVGGEGDGPNLLLCDLNKLGRQPGAPLDQVCRAHELPLERVGSVAIALRRRLLFASEGSRWFADGWRVQQVGLLGGEIIRRAVLGRSVGQIFHNHDNHSIYTARPALGAVDVRFAESLDLRGGYTIEPGFSHFVLDFPRNFLIGANPKTGRVLAVHLEGGRRLANVPIGTGITVFDYDRLSGKAIVGARRGLVRIDVLQLPAFRGQYLVVPNSVVPNSTE